MSHPAAAEVVTNLTAGLKQIEPLLRSHGFRLAERDAGKGSGGYLASADFVRDDRKLHLWLRLDSLGVHYTLGDRELDHSAYMRELLGPNGANHFPSYSNDVARAFEALRFDLEHFCGDFLHGAGAEFTRCWNATQQDAELTGIQRLARIERQIKRD
jgi:hypothetical protein